MRYLIFVFLTNITTKVDIVPYSNEEMIAYDPAKYEEDLKTVMTSDRDNIEKSKKAFVSYIRSYMEHDVLYLFACLSSLSKSI